jgi:hypothetical protein
LSIDDIGNNCDHISADFKPIQPGDLLIILGNTFHGGSAHSSVESHSRSSLLHDCHDLKFFIHCPGLNDPPNPSNGTVEDFQLFLTKQKSQPEFLEDHLKNHNSFQPALYE